MFAREFKTGKDGTLDASTPPLEALRLIVSHAADVDPGHPEVRGELVVSDVRRAFCYAKELRNVFIKLPADDGDAVEGEIGHLLLCLCGTRDVARETLRTLSRHLVSIGFVAGRGHPSIFDHPDCDIRMLVHGDD